MGDSRSSLASPPNLGLLSKPLSDIEAQLRGVHITREFHAFCYCPSVSPAAFALASLDQAALLRWSQECKDTIDLWCCCNRDAGTNLDVPSITTSGSNSLASKVFSALHFCVLAQEVNMVFRSLGKSQNDSESSLWRVLQMFWGEEATMKLKQTIFGSRPFMGPNSRTYINQLFNMITLSPDIHAIWGKGKFILEPVDEPVNSYQQNLRLQWVPPRRSSGNINLLTNPNSLDDVTEGQPKLPFNLGTGTRLESESIISATTHDPEIYPLPDRDLLRLQCNLIMVLRMAGRAGGDILETYDSDSEISSIATTISSQRNSSAYSSTQIHSDRVAPTSEPSRKISNSLFPKLLHFKDRVDEIVKLKRSKSSSTQIHSER
ncbi:hypothetical protein MMC31_004744, partial [Peltigera leucophlebia]|nr:hypothetical protein [Peltigera leucophlebia]